VLISSLTDNSSSYRFTDSLRAESTIPSWFCSQAVSRPVWHTSMLCVQWKTPDDGQRNCRKYVEFYSKNKFEKLVRLVGFIIRIYHNAGHLNVKQLSIFVPSYYYKNFNLKMVAIATETCWLEKVWLKYIINIEGHFVICFYRFKNKLIFLYV